MAKERLLTPAEVASRLQIKETTVREYLRTGHLRGIKLGRVWRIDPEDLKTFLQKHKTSS